MTLTIKSVHGRGKRLLIWLAQSQTLWEPSTRGYRNSPEFSNERTTKKKPNKPQNPRCSFKFVCSRERRGWFLTMILGDIDGQFPMAINYRSLKRILVQSLWFPRECDQDCIAFKPVKVSLTDHHSPRIRARAVRCSIPILSLAWTMQKPGAYVHEYTIRPSLTELEARRRRRSGKSFKIDKLLWNCF